MELKVNRTILFSHILREGNKLADAIANQALDEANVECHGFQDLSSKCRKILNSDKSQIPYLRVRIQR